MDTKIWEDAIRHLCERAQADPKFHALCQRDSGRAFQQVAGFKLPPGLTLRFADLQPGELVVPLPPLVPKRSGDALADEDLEQVAGGTAAAFLLGVVIAGVVIGIAS